MSETCEESPSETKSMAYMLTSYNGLSPFLLGISGNANGRHQTYILCPFQADKGVVLPDLSTNTNDKPFKCYFRGGTMVNVTLSRMIEIADTLNTYLSRSQNVSNYDPIAVLSLEQDMKTLKVEKAEVPPGYAGSDKEPHLRWFINAVSLMFDDLILSREVSTKILVAMKTNAKEGWKEAELLEMVDCVNTLRTGGRWG